MLVLNVYYIYLILCRDIAWTYYGAFSPKKGNLSLEFITRFTSHGAVRGRLVHAGKLGIKRYDS